MSRPVSLRTSLALLLSTVSSSHGARNDSIGEMPAIPLEALTVAKGGSWPGVDSKLIAIVDGDPSIDFDRSEGCTFLNLTISP